MALVEQKVSDFSAVSSLDGNELFYAIDDPSGSPTDGTVTPSVMANYIQRVNQLSLSYFIPMSGVVDNQFILTGVLQEVATGQTGDYATDFGAMGQHLCILVNSVTTGGDIVITGTRLSGESTGVPMAAATETITIDTTGSQYYQTDAKWLEITNIDISTGTIDTIDYDILVLGYLDRLNVDFVLTGFRLESRTSGDSSDLRLLIQKVQDDGGKKMSLVTIEDIGWDSSASAGDITDGLRTGGDDRSYTAGSNLIPDNSMMVIKQSDFETYFENDENVIEASTKNEGIIISFSGLPSGGLTQIDYSTLNIFFRGGI